MELTGTEKRIQALFSELSLADQKLAPRFRCLKPVRRLASRYEISRLIRHSRGFGSPIDADEGRKALQNACSGVAHILVGLDPDHSVAILKKNHR